MLDESQRQLVAGTALGLGIGNVFFVGPTILSGLFGRVVSGVLGAVIGAVVSYGFFRLGTGAGSRNDRHS